MNLLCIIDKTIKAFIRDDFTLDVEPSQGLIQPKWDGHNWIEA